MKVNAQSRTQYPADQFQIVGSSHRFNGQIETKWQSHDAVSKHIDDTVCITTVADNIREQQNSAWENKKSHATIGKWISAAALTGAALAGAVGAVILGTAVVEVAMAIGLLVIGAALVGGVVSAIGYSIAYSQQKKAVRQINSWKDPVREIAHHRREAGRLGYPYLRAEDDLRKHACAPAEKTSLALGTMRTYKDKYRDIEWKSEEEQGRFVDQFFVGNPLGSKNLGDAFGSDQLLAAHLRNASFVHRSHESRYNDVVRHAQERRNKINGEKTRILRELDSRRTWMLRRLDFQHSRAARYFAGSPTVRGCCPLSAWDRIGLMGINATYSLLRQQIENRFTSDYQRVINYSNDQINVVNDWELARKLLFVRPIGHILQVFLEGCQFDSKVCEIPPEKEKPAPQCEIRYVFPSIEDFKIFDQDNLFDLGVA